MNHLMVAVSQKLIERNLRCAVAESCTGGLLAAALTELPGSSQWFDCGFVTYSNQAKQLLLGVPDVILALDGAVSEATVLAMASGALKNSDAHISIATSGIAGPDGGSDTKPIGTVWIAWSGASMPARAQRYLFSGDRAVIRHLTVEAALQGVLSWLGS